MKIWKYPAGLAVAALLGTAAAYADSVNGHWALDASACGHFGATPAQSPLIVTDNALRWSSDACRIARMYKTGDTVYIQAMCWGEGGERSVPVSLRIHAGKLQVKWDRKSSGDLRRCS